MQSKIREDLITGMISANCFENNFPKINSEDSIRRYKNSWKRKVRRKPGFNVKRLFQAELLV